MVNELITPIVGLGAIGLIFGGILAFASRVFAVEVDPKVPEIKDALPGANCGGCGYPGCDAFAVAVAEGKAPVDGCPVGGSATAESLAEIMGAEVGSGEKMVARVLCNGTCENAVERADYYGVKDCREAAIAQGGTKGCQHGCMGLGTCEAVCPFDAIHIVEGNIAKVDPEKCTACNKCIEACPKNVIKLVPYANKVHVDCNSTDKGKEVKANCKVGCIGCRICVKNCPEQTISFADNLAKIEYEGCTHCNVCVEKCPTKAINNDLLNQKDEEEEKTA
ncbi:MAG TPA: ferredoxin [Eubacteriaceae bacterium]|nr:ferredoxin [Eubacteriaceae bacterium]